MSADNFQTLSANHLRRNGYVIINNNPCKIIDLVVEGMVKIKKYGSEDKYIHQSSL